MDKKIAWLTPIALILTAAVAPAQEPAPAPSPSPAAPAATERQFAGEVVSTDVPAKSLTVKATGKDPSGQIVEKTLTLAVSDAALPQLGELTTGDQVKVLWKRDAGQAKDVVLKIVKSTTPPAESPGS